MALFLAAHLAVAVSFAVRGYQQTLVDAKRRQAPPWQPPGWLNAYASLTGSNQGFGFFAPSVASEVRVAIEGARPGDPAWRPIDLGIRGEGQQLLSTFLGLGLQSEGPEVRTIHDTLSRSLAASAFNQNPDVKAVIVYFQAERIGGLYSKAPREREWLNLHVFPYYRANR